MDELYHVASKPNWVLSIIYLGKRGNYNDFLTIYKYTRPTNGLKVNLKKMFLSKILVNAKNMNIEIVITRILISNVLT